MARFQSLRGLLGLSIASAIAWIPLAAVLGMAESLLRGRSITIGRVLSAAPLSAAVGAFCGFSLGLALVAAERKRTFEGLTLGRFVSLGVASALVIPATAILVDATGFSLGGVAYSLAIFGIPGGLTAAALLTIARRAPQRLEPLSAPVAIDGP